MTGHDRLVLFGICPAFVLVGGVASYAVWRYRIDVSASMRWLVGQGGAAGFQAGLLPNTVGLGLTWAALIAAPAWKDTNPSTLSVVLFVAALAAILYGFWLWAFMWPKMSVPPHLRGEPGWVVYIWRARRARRLARRVSVEPRA